jgi:putative CocE/NonD family hydrolase
MSFRQPYRRTDICLLALWLLSACLSSTPTSSSSQVVPPQDGAPPVIQAVSFTTSDGVEMRAYLRGAGDLSPRPLIVEFSPYGGNGIPDFGPAYNHLFVHARGTGESTGAWSAVGPRDQQDISEFLAWACTQSWSNGHIGLYGFSASAIAVYNSMHLPLACVEAAALMAGTNELYRDLLYPGGMPNVVPEVVVGVGVGVPIMQSTGARIRAGQSPIDGLQAGLGLQLIAADVFLHDTEDDYWLGRTQRAGPNVFPVLADTGFYDVESRGPFESFRMLRALGVPVHLRVFGAHDGFPANTPGPFPDYQRWFDHYLLHVDNGADSEPAVRMLIGDGSYESQIAGNVQLRDATDWPVPGTRWQKLYLDAARGGGARSINDGQLVATVPVAGTPQIYPAITSLGPATDPNTTSAAGAGAFLNIFPFFMTMALVEPLALTYTTPALSSDVEVVGPASLDLFLASALPEADLYAVLADVWPDGNAHAVGIGRLRTTYPEIIAERSRIDDNGEIVEPYPDHTGKTLEVPGVTREYHVEFWPVGNRFLAGHRVRLYLTGAPMYILPTPDLNVVSVGGGTPSRLLLPVLPGSDLLNSTAR